MNWSNEYNKTDIEIMKRVVKDYKQLKKEIDERIKKGYKFENILDYIRHLSSCTLINVEEEFFDFNYCDMTLSVYKDLRDNENNCYLGDSIGVWNDKDLYHIDTFNYVEDIEKEIEKYENNL